ncbi:MAG: hypothetical protein ABL970_17820 [Nitrospira sp.]
MAAIGTIGRSLTDAGMLFDGPSEAVVGNAAERFPVDESLELVVGVAIGSEASGALATGFFINL